MFAKLNMSFIAAMVLLVAASTLNNVQAAAIKEHEAREPIQTAPAW